MSTNSVPSSRRATSWWSFFGVAILCVVLNGTLRPAMAAEPASVALTAEEREAGFRPLFNGKTLEGWEGKAGVFRVEDGAIVAGTLKKPIPNNEFLCTTRDYGDFELRLKARLIGEGKNAGVQFRSRRIPDHHEVIGYQCDIGAGGERLIWGSLYDESRRRRFLAEGDAEQVRKVFQGDQDGESQWNELVIRCEGDHVQIWLNGYQTVDYRETDDNIEDTGIIGLQIHSGPPAEAWYKDIRIRPLK